ncbi:MAG: tRNA uracil 4-sulfurtransferase ThiI [Acholeplasmataceae bacterium]
MKKKILIRFGDLMLKGKNIKTFINKITKHIENKIAHLDTELIKNHDRLYLLYKVEDEDLVIKLLKKIAGIASFSVVYEATLEIDNIVDVAVSLIQDQMPENRPQTFKIETKRANKNFPMTSQEATIHLAALILKKANRPLSVDVHHPEDILTIEIRNEATYIYLKKIKGMGGYPASSGDGGMVMISGGIDSPVAAYLAIKQGINVQLIHFESTPLTPLESTQKVIDLAKVLSTYMPHNNITLHLVPFLDIHQAILAHVPSAYAVTIMRRMMYQIAEKHAIRNHCHALINGESVGQVASQTLQSLRAVEVVTKLPVLRPVVTTNKDEIVNIAKMIETFDISIRPFEDCCSIYVPEHPATKPRDYIAERYEQLFPAAQLIEETMKHIITETISSTSDLILANYAFEVKEALDLYHKEKGHMHD